MALKIKKLDRGADAQKYWVEGEVSQAMIFGFSDTLLSLWGRPGEDQLLQVIEAYVDKHGFSPAEHILRSYNVSGGLHSYLMFLKS
ncbi:MAG TPA: hypothetical protein VL688_12695 [Verrucomicrobiae bacterium]|jgi:hypothetical protein|nr:hypothetical protein [Verrucomicrobiae bacterium]